MDQPMAVPFLAGPVSPATPPNVEVDATASASGRRRLLRHRNTAASPGSRPRQPGPEPTSPRLDGGSSRGLQGVCPGPSNENPGHLAPGHPAEHVSGQQQRARRRSHAAAGSRGSERGAALRCVRDYGTTGSPHDRREGHEPCSARSFPGRAPTTSGRIGVRFVRHDRRGSIHVNTSTLQRARRLVALLASEDPAMTAVELSSIRN